MNPILRSLYERKSVRAYTERELSEETVQTILAAAAQAPSPGNQQLYTIIRVTDADLKRRLSVSCDNQPFIEKAKLVLVFCADCLKWYKAFREGGCEPRRPDVGDLLLAVCDANIAAQNAVVAAESLGVGSCYIGDIMENIETQREILGLPELVFPAAMLVFGYPTEQQKERIKPKRAELRYIVSEDSYHRLSREELKQMLLKNCCEETYDGWIAAFCKRKYNSDFSREMTRSVREYLKQFKDRKSE
jgi:nitroreductase/FMN reductase (NADPH)/FMN reductase [NAD(P)H]